MKKERIYWIDVCKGFLILLVVIGHVIASYRSAGMTNTFYQYLSCVIYSFHMACFVFVGGVLFNIKKDRTKLEQTKYKLISYGIPYVIFSFIWVMFKLIFSKYVNSSVDLKDFLLIVIYPISFMWYIYATMIMNIVQIQIENYKKKLFIITLGGILLLIVPFLTSEFSHFSEIILCDFISFWFYFLLGHYYGKQIIDLSSNITVYVVSIIIFIMFSILYFKVPLIGSYYCRVLTSLSGIIIVMGLFKNVKKNKLLKYLGEKSLSIYVLQGIIIAVTRIVVSKISILNDPYGILPLIICTAAGCFLPLVIELMSRKIWKLDFVFYPNKYLK